MSLSEKHYNTDNGNETPRKKMANVKLNSLLVITKAINNNVSTENLLELYQTILVDELNIGKIALFTCTANHWHCVLKRGIASGNEEYKIDVDLLQYREITEVNLINTHTEQTDTFDVVIPVYHKNQPLAYLLIGDLDEQKIEMSPTLRHLPFVQTLTNIIIVAIENKRLARASMAQAAAKRELELASEMQAMLFPEQLPKDRFMDIDALYKPHQQVGGDYYDYFSVSEQEVVFCVADVSGKGVSAALLMANFQANLRALFRYNNDLPEIIHELNTLVFSNAKGEKFITLFLARYNKNTRALHYINAGHNPPLLKQQGTIHELTTGCVGMGMLTEIPQVSEGVIHIKHDATLVCYTDGLTEQFNADGEDFGVARLKNKLLFGEEKEMKELNTHIMQDLDAFRGEEVYADDIAIFSFYFR